MHATGAVTTVATGVLEIIDAVLVGITTICHAFVLLARTLPFLRPKTDAPRPSVVIVGASFAGLWAQRALSGRFDVTVVDLKDYFEYTPGVLRLFVEPDHLRRIAKPLPRHRCKTVLASVTDVAPTHLAVQYPDGTKGEIRFDYLLLATGSSYPAVHGRSVVKAGADQSSLDARAATWEDAAARLTAADDAIVVGGGPVGVELAAEIAASHPGKKVTLISRSEILCAALPSKVGELCLRWLQAHGVEVVRGVATSEIRDDGVTLTDGRELSAHVVYNCAGSLPNTHMFKAHLSTHMDAKTSRLVVNDQLQLVGQPHIYVMGDVMQHHASSELKLGHTAELNAHVAAHNVIAHASGKPAAMYPNGAHGLGRSPQVYCVSLGKHAAVLAFNGIVIGGWFAAINKWLCVLARQHTHAHTRDGPPYSCTCTCADILCVRAAVVRVRVGRLEWTKVAACEERPVGVLFWDFADAVTALLSRTILPVPESRLPPASPQAARKA